MEPDAHYVCQDPDLKHWLTNVNHSEKPSSVSEESNMSDTEDLSEVMPPNQRPEEPRDLNEDN